MSWLLCFWLGSMSLFFSLPSNNFQIHTRRKAMPRPKRKNKLKMSSKITPRTAMQSAIIVLCRQPLHRRIQVAWAIVTAKYKHKTV